MLGHTLALEPYLDRLREEIERVDRRQVERLADLLFDAWQNERFVFLLGNGGSATTASHLAEDLGKTCMSPDAVDSKSPQTHRRLKVLSLTDNVGWITALANDYSYEEVFVQQLMQYGRPGDLVVAISGSGNSPNVLAAVEWANRQGLVTYGMTGYDGGKLKQTQQAGLHVALDDMAMVETIHMAVGHWLVGHLYGRVVAAG